MLKRPRVLLCDDEAVIRMAVGDYLDAHGLDVHGIEDLAGLRAVLRVERPDAIVLDYRLPDGFSLDVVPEVKALHPDLPIIILTGHASIDLAVKAIKAGADQFLTKPVDLSALEVMIRRLLTSRKVAKRDAASRSRAGAQTVDPFIGKSEVMARLQRDAERLAATDRAVLIEGETGSGKGVLAQWLHRSGPRADDPIVELNCAAFARELIDSELFGHERGAFTGAVAAKQGLFEVADGGTLFLDEIGDMDLALQAKLLKAVEEQKFRRVGDLRDRTCDVRLIAATHRNLAELARQEKFRSDLYFRISTMRIAIPPLRARREDIPQLATHFLRALAADMALTEATLDASALEALSRYAWPGNVRELRNVIERALILADGPVISAADLRFDFASREAGGDTLADAERAHVQRIVGEEGGDVDRAAARLGIARSTLYQKLKNYSKE
ncbi:MAG TPA: sigma-54 dependent transcriptional regulator [Thermoanaerobaculia bacterium]|jgi:DNA-binding NtrC family response regulator